MPLKCAYEEQIDKPAVYPRWYEADGEEIFSIMRERAVGLHSGPGRRKAEKLPVDTGAPQPRAAL